MTSLKENFYLEPPREISCFEVGEAGQKGSYLGCCKKVKMMLPNSHYEGELKGAGRLTQRDPFLSNLEDVSTKVSYFLASTYRLGTR